ncbi:MAG: MoxR family ATPase [Lachnospiraceae bacterium]|nr:MoxR family ATPase [Lachnospiraceae bacterium]
MSQTDYTRRYENTNIIKVMDELNKVVVGKDTIIEYVLCAMLAGGHVLIEDVPGVGKTTLALGISQALALSYKRVQFTPDVLPSDVTGFMMYNKKINDFEYKEGAVMTNLLLADEINRTSSKTQSALLEVMEEGKVTVDSVTRELPEPFFVLATQNPLGYAGTQRLPESQLDRFMVQVSMGYPDMESEMLIYQGKQREAMKQVHQVLTKEEFTRMQEQVRQVEIKDSVCEYLAKLVQSTRRNPQIELGISPRGGLALLNMAKANAYLQNRDYVVPEDILDVWEVTVCHRIVLSQKGRMSGVGLYELLEEIKVSVPMPK